ncbi:MAG: D-alanine--D-alanine ligase [Bacteroidetes bacterium]|nr:D-alanine--D-alanine ligase [Bacteroidota bacterium]
MRKKIHVAIVYNEPTVTTSSGRKYISESGVLYEEGQPSENNAEVSIDMSEAGVLDEMNDIKRALIVNGYKTTLFNVNSDIMRLIDFLRGEQPDVIFNICESIGKESSHEMHVAGIYELLGIPYTGANAMTLGLAQSKVRVKEILGYYGLLTPKFQLMKNPARIVIEEDLDFPLFVKPAREDASVGITTDSVVYNLTNLRKQVRHIIEQFSQPALVEEYIEGRELNVAILGNSKPVALPISEIDMSTLPDKYHKIITYNAKWMKGTEEYEHTKGYCPADLPAAIEQQLKEMALKAYTVIGGRDYARVDFRLTKDNKPYILEFNPNPDIANDTGFARSVKASGLTFEEMVKRIVELALERTA